MDPEFFCQTFPDPQDQSSAFARIDTRNYRSRCYMAVVRGKEHRKAIGLFEAAWAATQEKSYSLFDGRENDIWNRVQPALPKDVKTCFFYVDLGNMGYKKVWMQGYKNGGGEFDARLPMAAIAFNYVYRGQASARPMVWDSHDDNEMFLLCAAPFVAEKQEKELEAAANEAFKTLCRPLPESGWDDARACFSTVFPGGAMAIAADKGLAMEQVDWNALPVKSLDGQLHLQFHSSETDLYGKEKGSVTRENTVPIRTGALPTAGIDARIVDIISPSEIVILAEKKLYTLKKGEQITISREFDGYEDHEGVVWSTDTVTYTITFP